MIEIEAPDFADYQKAVLYSKKRFTVTEASTKAGKTFMSIYWLFAAAHATCPKFANKLNPYLKPAKAGNEYWWVAPVYDQSKIAFNRMKRKVAHTGMYAINKAELTITTPLDTVIRFKTGRDPDNLYGEDVHAAIMDEFTRMSRESWYALRSTLTATKAPCKFIGNYKGNANWGHHLALKANEPNSEYERFKITAFDAVEAGILDPEEVEQARKDLPTFMFKALYLAEGDIDEARLINDDAIHDLKTNTHVTAGEKYLTCDIAFEGSDRFVAVVWSGLQIIDIKAFNKVKADEVESIIRKIAEDNGIRQSNIAYDADGVGGFLKGYLRNAKEFHNNGTPVKQGSRQIDYKNLKSQCYFELARYVNEGKLYINCEIDEHFETIFEELQVVKNRSKGTDGKLEVLRKPEIKEIIGRSPDYSDALMMRMYFELKPKAWVM